MIGLVVKDIINLKNSLRTSLLILMLFSFIAYQSQDPSYLVATFVFLVALQSISSISYDDMAKWDIYALTMPISRAKLVRSKYILSMILLMVALMISGTIGYFLILPVSNMSTKEFLFSSYLISMIAILFLSVLLPLVYKYGVEKSRLLLFAVILVPVLFGMFLNRMGVDLPSGDQLLGVVKISPVIIILALFISNFISYRIYKNKDM